MNRVMIVTVIVAGIIWYTGAHTHAQLGGSKAASEGLGFVVCIVGLGVGVLVELLTGGNKH